MKKIDRGHELAAPALLDKLRARGYAIDQGDDIRDYLDLRNANAATFLEQDLLLRRDARTIEVLEEYLHNIQRRVGLTEEMPPWQLEIHVKDFMLRHRTLLRIKDADARWLGEWLDKARGV